MIVELIGGVTALVIAGTALWREIRQAKNLSRAELIAKGEEVAWGIVEGMKAEAHKRGRPMSRDDIANAFKKATFDYIQNKGLKGFTFAEAEALHKSAELLSRAGRHLLK